MKFIDASGTSRDFVSVLPKHSRAEVHFTEGPPLLLRGREAIRVTSDLAKAVEAGAASYNLATGEMTLPEKPKAPKKKAADGPPSEE